MSNWIYFDGSNPVGPMSLQDLKVAARRGAIGSKTWVAAEGAPYQLAESVGDLSGLLSSPGQVFPQPTPPWQVSKPVTTRHVKSAGAKKPVILAVAALVLVGLAYLLFAGPATPPPIQFPSAQRPGSISEVPAAGPEGYRVIFLTEDGVSIPLPDEAWVAAGCPSPSGFRQNKWFPLKNSEVPEDKLRKEENRSGFLRDPIGGKANNYPEFPDFASIVTTAIGNWGMPDYVAISSRDLNPDVTPNDPADFTVTIVFLWKTETKVKAHYANSLSCSFYKGKSVRAFVNGYQHPKYQFEKELSGESKKILSERADTGGPIRLKR